VAERAFDVICLLVVFGLTLIFQFDVIHSMAATAIYPLFRNSEGQTSYHKLIYVLVGGVVVILVMRFIFSRYAHISIIQKVRAVFLNIWHGLTSVRSLKNKPLFFAYSAGIWLLYLLSTYMGFFAITETRGLTVTDALSVLAMGSIGMIVSPGGIGAYALLVQETVSFYNVAKEPYGQALGWLLWFGQFLSFILFGVVSFIILPRINKKKNEGTTDHPA
jgi:hypothetical protein